MRTLSPASQLRAALAVALMAAGLSVGLSPAAVYAGQASTPVGQLTATQVYCNDPGAHVLVTVAGGFPNTGYQAISTYESPLNQGPYSFTTDSSGSGSVVVGYGWWSGTHYINVTANGQAGAVSYEANCDNGGGD
jgi:hypothetical protein